MKYAGTKEEQANSVEMYGPNGENLPNGGNYDANYRYSQTMNGSGANPMTNGTPPITPGKFGTLAGAAMSQFAFNQQAVGTTPGVVNALRKSEGSLLKKRMDGDVTQDLPQGPGFTYFNHLFNRAGGTEKDKENKKKKMTNGSNIYTEAQEALKVAIKAMGIATSMNPTGLPIDTKDAEHIYFGEEEADDNDKLQWRTSVEMGDARIDPKKVRKFTNYDGSMTWEILNDDKTVSSRFTLGEFAGTKIFSQGGYNKFVELMQKVKQQVGYDDSTGFDAIRGKY